MKIAIGSDHTAYAFKGDLAAYLRGLGHEVEDFGCASVERVDYPDYAAFVADAVADGRAERGVIICFSGIGVSIAANKVKGIRCALCAEPVSARLSRAHNDSNMLAMGAGMIGFPMAKEILSVWLDTAFDGERHEIRVKKISALEAR